METMQIQCGQCSQLMAISLEHLGSQVHCPHCQAIVQTPTSKAAPPEVKAADQSEPKIGGWLEAAESESIFAPPEPSDDLFGHAPPRPKVEVPPEKPWSAPSESVDTRLDPYIAEDETQHRGTLAEPASARETPWHHAHSEKSEGFSEQIQPASPSQEDNLAALAPVRSYKQSMLVPTLLIFLVPYSLVMTGLVIYLLIQSMNAIHPLEMLSDPKPKEGGKQERVKHDMELPAHLKTTLTKTIRVGDIEVTPLKVSRNQFGDLELVLKTKNVSSSTRFTPVSDEFFHKNKANDNPVYTFLDTGNRRFYGGFLFGPPGKDTLPAGNLGPGQEEIVRIVTANEDRARADLKKLASSQASFLWRVQVRRGLVTGRGNSISATAVIGISFTAKEIEPG